MDEKVIKLTPFRDLAEGLAARGIASLRYDKRTFAHARKLVKTSPTVKEETIDDALLAVRMLKEEPAYSLTVQAVRPMCPTRPLRQNREHQEASM